jgi:hypothetical protein
MADPATADTASVEIGEMPADDKGNALALARGKGDDLAEGADEFLAEEDFGGVFFGGCALIDATAAALSSELKMDRVIVPKSGSLSSLDSASG